MDGPIIEHLTDMDYYKMTMWNFNRAMGHGNVPVKYSQIVRTKDARLALFVDEVRLREELENVRTLSISDRELGFLEAQGVFPPDAIEELRGILRPQPGSKYNALPEFELERVGDDYRVEFSGPVNTAIFWETLHLSIMNQLYMEYEAEHSGSGSGIAKLVLKDGEEFLSQKIERLKPHPEIKIIEFGTRRRYSRDWQYHVTERMANEVPDNLVGTSNIYLAMLLDILVRGTTAHEETMLYSGIYRSSIEELLDSHNRVLRDWRTVYNDKLSIALTDTYGTRFFWRQFTPEQASLWTGLRQDSGNPLNFGDAAFAFYTALGIPVNTKALLFSDGLDLDMIFAINDYFKGVFMKSYGWGTGLTNHMGLKPLSIVVKMTEANGYPCVKLSDNLNKALGPPELIDYFCKVFDYSGGIRTECRV